jgi:hypothetical protein
MGGAGNVNALWADTGLEPDTIALKPASKLAKNDRCPSLVKARASSTEYFIKGGP